MDGMNLNMDSTGPTAMLGRAFSDGWRLWMRRPWMLGLLMLSPILAELVIQPIPRFGMLLSKVLAFLLVGVIWIALDQFARSGRLDATALRATLAKHAGAWFALMLVGLVLVFGFQVLTGRVLFGPPALEWLLLGDMTHPPQQPLALLAVIPAGAIPATLLMLAMPLALLHGMPALDAVRASLRIVISNIGFFALYTLATMALLLIGIVTVLGLLLVVPWLTATGYTIYRSFVADAETAMLA